MNLELKSLLDEVFQSNPEARSFCFNYVTMCHKIDDVIDEKKTDPDYILELTQLQANVYGSEFYRKYYHYLVLIDALVNNDYNDSCLWEESDVEWKRNHADVLRHAGHHMLFAVILLISKREMLRKISPLFREYSQERNLNDIINYENKGNNNISEDKG